MMKSTQWKEFVENGHRYRILVTYGLDYGFAARHNQKPYFSITADIEEKDSRRPGHWRESSAGMQHDAIAKHFPELRPYLKWHLVSTGEPTHYLANAKYFWEQAMGVSKWERRAHDPDPSEAFKSTIVFGGIPGETMPTLNHWPEVERWLKGRLPALMGTFAANMDELEVLE